MNSGNTRTATPTATAVASAISVVSISLALSIWRRNRKKDAAALKEESGKINGARYPPTPSVRS